MEVYILLALHISPFIEGAFSGYKKTRVATVDFILIFIFSYHNSEPFQAL